MSQQETTSHDSADVENSTNNSATADASQPSAPAHPASVQTNPTIKPTLIALGLAIVVVLAIVGVILSNQRALGGQSIAEIAAQVVAIVGLLIGLRLLLRIFILTRTTYSVNTERIQRKYTLFLRTSKREVPIQMVRSSQLEQSRIQKILGYGSIRVNEGLGGIRLEHVENPHEVQDVISTHSVDEPATV
ncbi:PH domain-containing protein [Halobaculum limi]|uniref:PH domain-containing protein n=1 Tax=Halobaculum limi TaxID=3031916 RepID=UPI0024058106|nr:PH domain-containing protein [Halobaculum sp. YSMS11]